MIAANTTRPNDETPTASGGAAVARKLLENNRRFLDFLVRRVGDRSQAEEILQEAYLRTLTQDGPLRDDSSAVAWFYRVLRNALVDHFRRRASEERALEAMAARAEEAAPTDEELLRAVCTCVEDLLATLKPEYARAIRRVDLDGAGLPTLAAELGITPGNASVRLHRARRALRTRVSQCCGACSTHLCFDCSCKKR